MVHAPLGDVLQSRHGRWLIKLHTAVYLYCCRLDSSSHSPHAALSNEDDAEALLPGESTHLLTSETIAGLSVSAGASPPPFDSSAMTKLLSKLWETSTLEQLYGDFLSVQWSHDDVKRHLHAAWVDAQQRGGDSLAAVGQLFRSEYLHRALCALASQGNDDAASNNGTDSSCHSGITSCHSSTHCSVRSAQGVTVALETLNAAELLSKAYTCAVKILRELTPLHSSELSANSSMPFPPIALLGCEEGSAVEHGYLSGELLRKEVLLELQRSPRYGGKGHEVEALLPMSCFADWLIYCDGFSRRLQYLVTTTGDVVLRESSLLEYDGRVRNVWFRASYLHKDLSMRRVVLEDQRRLSLGTTTSPLYQQWKASRRWFDAALHTAAHEARGSSLTRELVSTGGRLCPPFRPFFAVVSEDFLQCSSVTSILGGAGSHATRLLHSLTTHFAERSATEWQAELHEAARAVSNMKPLQFVAEVSQEYLDALVDVDLVLLPHNAANTCGHPIVLISSSFAVKDGDGGGMVVPRRLRKSDGSSAAEVDLYTSHTSQLAVAVGTHHVGTNALEWRSAVDSSLLTMPPVQGRALTRNGSCAGPVYGSDATAAIRLATSFPERDYCTLSENFCAFLASEGTSCLAALVPFPRTVPCLTPPQRFLNRTSAMERIKARFSATAACHSLTAFWFPIDGNYVATALEVLHQTERRDGEVTSLCENGLEEVATLCVLVGADVGSAEAIVRLKGMDSLSSMVSSLKAAAPPGVGSGGDDGIEWRLCVLTPSLDAVVGKRLIPMLTHVLFPQQEQLRDGKLCDDVLRRRVRDALSPLTNDRLEFLGDAVLDYTCVRRVLLTEKIQDATGLGERLTRLTNNIRLGSKLPSLLRRVIVLTYRIPIASKMLGDVFEAIVASCFLYAAVDLKRGMTQAVADVECLLEGVLSDFF